MKDVRFRSLACTVAVVVSGAGWTSSGTGAASPGTTTVHVAASASKPPSCRSEELKLGVGPAFGAAGTERQYFSLTNRASRSCTLTGYPGVSFVDDDGHVVADDFERGSDPPPSAVTLSAGSSASFKVELGTGGAGSCRSGMSWTTVRVIPPDDTGVLSAPFKGSACGRPAVYAVQPGPPPESNG
jgi:hypothetical protein